MRSVNDPGIVGQLTLRRQRVRGGGVLSDSGECGIVDELLLRCRLLLRQKWNSGGCRRRRGRRRIVELLQSKDSSVKVVADTSMVTKSS